MNSRSGDVTHHNPADALSRAGDDEAAARVRVEAPPPFLESSEEKHVKDEYASERADQEGALWT